MQNNIEIYLIGLSVLIILITIFFIIKKISSNGDLKVKIEPVLDDIELNEDFDDVNMELKSQSSFDFDQNYTKPNSEDDDQELAILNLISVYLLFKERISMVIVLPFSVTVPLP